MYMLISATIFAGYDVNTRMDYVRRYYNAISKHKINIPTPIMAGVRTPLRQFVAVFLLMLMTPSILSFEEPDMGIGRYVAQKGRNRYQRRSNPRHQQQNQRRRGSTHRCGPLPQKFESTVRCCTQNGIRGGSAAVHFPIWHQEIEDIIVLKNNKGTEDNRVRKLDYSIQISRIFYERFIQDGDISLFSPHDVPGLYDALVLLDLTTCMWV